MFTIQSGTVLALLVSASSAFHPQPMTVAAFRRTGSKPSFYQTTSLLNAEKDDPTKVWYAEIANGIQNILTNSPLAEGIFHYI